MLVNVEPGFEPRQSGFSIHAFNLFSSVYFNQYLLKLIAWHFLNPEVPLSKNEMLLFSEQLP